MHHKSFRLPRNRRILFFASVMAAAPSAFTWTFMPLASVELSHETEQVAGTEKVLRAKEAYLKEGKQINFPIVQNLRDIFQEFIVDDTRPLIALDNFRQVNVGPLDYPVILRTPVPTVHRKVIGRKSQYHVILGSSTVLYRNMSSFDNIEQTPCSESIFLDTFNVYKYLCLVIRWPVFVLKLKPFGLTVHIKMYPPIYIVQLEMGEIYLELFIGLGYALSSYITFPSEMVINGMILLRESHESVYTEHNTLLRWINEVLASFDRTANHHTFLIFSVGQIVNASIIEERLLDTAGYIKYIRVLQICPSCSHPINSTHGMVLPIKLESFNYEYIRRVAFINLDVNPVWAPANMHEDVLVVKTFNFCRNCVIKGKYEFWKKYMESNTLSSLEWVALAHSHVWNSIMRNFTLASTGDNGECTDWVTENSNFVISMDPFPYLSSLMTFPYFLSNHTNKLRIVGCAERGESPLPFEEFIWVFEKCVWFAILVSSVTFMLGTRFLINDSFTPENLMSVLKVLLEQGDPFQNFVVRRKQVRIMIGLFLLMGLILSNAYKNTNVYNMVVHRKPILYSYFEELKQDNIIVYTRGLSMYEAKPQGCKNKNPNHSEKCFEIMEGFAHTLMTEVEDAAEQYAYNFFAKHRGSQVDPTLITNGLQDAVSLHEEVKLKYRNSLLEMISNRSYSFDEANLIGYYALKNISAPEQTKIIQRSLVKCHRAAAVLPEMLARYTYKVLVKTEKLPNAFIGKESFSSIDWLFTVGGIVSPNLIKRIHGIGESGVWQLWVKMFTETYLRNENVSEVKAVNMEGNVVMVFVVWAVGAGIAILSGLLEYTWVEIYPSKYFYYFISLTGMIWARCVAVFLH